MSRAPDRNRGFISSVHVDEALLIQDPPVEFCLQNRYITDLM